MHHYICFDIGGSFIKYAAVSASAEVLFSDKVPTPLSPQPDQAISLMNEIINEAKKKIPSDGTIEAVGISIHGIVDPEKGCISCSSHYVASLVNFPIIKRLQQLTQLPAYIDNDVKAAAQGELWQGQAQLFTNSIILTLGSSIGGAIIIDKKLFRGINNGAGELGYLITDEHDKSDKAFMAGAWERFASASVLVREYRLTTNNPEANSQDFQKALEKNDPQAKDIFRRFLYSLTSGLISIAHAFAPEAIIIGGAIIEMENKLFDPVRQLFEKRVLPAYQIVNILPATLGQQAALLGMAYTCQQQLSKKLMQN